MQKKKIVGKLVEKWIYHTFFFVFTINIGIGTYFFYCKYMNHDKKTVAKEGSVLETTIY